MILYVQGDLVRRLGLERLSTLAWDFLMDTCESIKGVPPIVCKSVQDGVYVMHPSLSIKAEEEFINFLRMKADTR